MAGEEYIVDIVGVIHAGLVSAKDTRMTYNEVGDAVVLAGLPTVIGVYVEFLTYCITGGKKSDGGSQGEQQAPNSL